MGKVTQVNNNDSGLTARTNYNEAMKTVETDATLSGDGTAGNPLKVESGSSYFDNINATTAPTITNDSSENYEVGSTWIDVTNDNVYKCVDATVGAAVWEWLNEPSANADATVITLDPTDIKFTEKEQAFDYTQSGAVTLAVTEQSTKAGRLIYGGWLADGNTITKPATMTDYSGLFVANQYTPSDGDILDLYLATIKQGGSINTRINIINISGGAPVEYPTIISVSVESGSADTLDILLSEACNVLDLTGQLLSFTSGTPKTISSIISGSGTNSFKYRTSDPIASDDIFSLVIQSSNTIKSVANNIAVQSVTKSVNNNVLPNSILFQDEFLGTSLSTQWTYNDAGVAFSQNDKLLIDRNVTSDYTATTIQGFSPVTDDILVMKFYFKTTKTNAFGTGNERSTIGFVDTLIGNFVLIQYAREATINNGDVRLNIGGVSGGGVQDNVSLPANASILTGADIKIVCNNVDNTQKFYAWDTVALAWVQFGATGDAVIVPTLKARIDAITPVSYADTAEFGECYVTNYDFTTLNP